MEPKSSLLLPAVPIGLKELIFWKQTLLFGMYFHGAFNSSVIA
jgi:hypothetical protein